MTGSEKQADAGVPDVGPADTDDTEFRDAYELGRCIGSGGSSEVFEAVQRRLDRPVAIKLLNADALADPAWRERFMREAQTCANLSHPNVLMVFDHGLVGGRPFLVTELVEGQSLALLMGDRARLTAGAVFTVVEQLLDGLEAIHDAGVVHRDLKPENVLVTGGPDLVVKISDFGVAKRAGGHGPVTAQGVVLGTPAYMAPEQVAGQQAGPSSDLYAVAVMLYEMVLGEHPFARETSTRDMLNAQLFAEPRVPWTLHPGLRRVLEKGLVKAPEQRFQSAAAMRRALREVEGEILGEAGVVSRPSGPIPLPGVRRPVAAVLATSPSGDGKSGEPFFAPPLASAPDRAGRLVAALGVCLALALAAVLPALVWLRP